MECHRSRQLGSGHRSAWLQNRVLVHSTSQRSHEGDASPPVPSAEGRFRGRNSWPAAKERNPHRTTRFASSPLQVQLLSHSQETGFLETHLEPKATQQEIHPPKKVPHGNTSLHHSHLCSRDVGHLSRFKGRLPTHTDPSELSEVSSLPVQTHGLCFPGSTLRPRYSTKSLHKGVEGGPSLSPSLRNNTFCLYRRLAHSGQFPTGVPGGNSLCHSGSPGSRMDNQLGKVQPTTIPVRHLPRCSSRPSAGTSHAHTSKDREHHPGGLSPVVQTNFSGPSVAPLLGPRREYGGDSTSVQTVHETSPVLPPGAVQSLPGPVVFTDSPYEQHQTFPTLVDRTPKPVTGETICRRQTGSHNHNRCFKQRLGSDLGGQVDSGPVVSSGDSSSHQPSRAFSREESCSSVGERTQGDQTPSLFRQLHDSVVSEPSGRNQVQVTVSADLGLSSVVPVSEHLSECIPCSRETEHVCRRPVQRTIQQSRVGTEPVLGGLDFSNVRTSSHRPLRNLSQPQAPNLLFQETSPSGLVDGRPGSQLGRSIGVRLSTTSTSLESTAEATAIQGYYVTSGAPLAETTVVSSHTTDVGGSPLPLPRRSSSPVTAQGQNPASGPQVTPASCLEIVNRRFISEGLSQRSAALASGARRKSTIKTYDSRLEKFFSWAQDHSWNPMETTVDNLCSFFVFLFDEGRQVSTIKNYRSAIAAIHPGFSDGSTVSSNETISALLKGMFNQRPPRQRLAPSWSINDVLSALSREPYEPIHNAPLDALTKKTVFLVAAASARRRSELHALSIEPGFIRFSPNGVHLLPNPNFLAKNQTVSFSPTPMFLPTISSISSIREDRFVCPVRALKWYLEKTKTLRTSNAMFVLPRSPYTPASRDTISRWLVELISLFASPDESPRAHDVRAHASSTAWFRGVPLDDVMKAASWKSPSTFISCYLTNVVSPDSNFARSVLCGSSQSS